LFAEPVYKAFGQRDNIFFAFPQRGNLDVDGIDAVKQIFAEFAFGHHLFQITIGGANQTYVDRYRFVASYSHHAPALNGGE